MTGIRAGSHRANRNHFYVKCLSAVHGAFGRIRLTKDAQRHMTFPRKRHMALVRGSRQPSRGLGTVIRVRQIRLAATAEVPTAAYSADPGSCSLAP